MMSRRSWDDTATARDFYTVVALRTARAEYQTDNARIDAHLDNIDGRSRYAAEHLASIERRVAAYEPDGENDPFLPSCPDWDRSVTFGVVTLAFYVRAVLACTNSLRAMFVEASRLRGDALRFVDNPLLASDARRLYDDHERRVQAQEKLAKELRTRADDACRRLVRATTFDTKVMAVFGVYGVYGKEDLETNLERHANQGPDGPNAFLPDQKGTHA
jgi:hypothetical protein